MIDAPWLQRCLCNSGDIPTSPSNVLLSNWLKIKEVWENNTTKIKKMRSKRNKYLNQPNFYSSFFFHNPKILIFPYNNTYGMTQCEQ